MSSLASPSPESSTVTRSPASSSVGRELDGVTKEVVHDLRDACGIEAQQAGSLGGLLEGDVAIRRSLGERGHGVPQDGVHVGLVDP